MPELIEFFRQNPLLAIFLGLWILSAIANAGARALRKTVAPKPGEAATDATETKTVAPRAPKPAGVPSADEIAAEIRRLIGGKRAEAEEPEAPEPEQEPEPVRPPPRRSEPAPKRTVPVAVPTVTVAPRPVLPPATSEELVARALAKPARRRVSRRILDLADPAAAIVAMEVLGPPRSLRAWD